MITSYVTPQRTMLYLSLVGPLDADGADELVNEYYERQAPSIRRCILDLGSVDNADERGLAVLHRLSLLAQVDQVEFSVVAGKTSHAPAVSDAAERYWIPVVDSKSVTLTDAAQPTQAAS
jgi:ABC-type transporter Mla MlaB component